MNEVDWNSSTDPQGMLDFLGDSGRLTERKSRLFAVAAGRHGYWTQIEDLPECRKVFEVAEQDADGLASREELNAAYLGAGAWADHFNDANFGIWGPCEPSVRCCRPAFASSNCRARSCDAIV